MRVLNGFRKKIRYPNKTIDDKNCKYKQISINDVIKYVKTEPEVYFSLAHKLKTTSLNTRRPIKERIGSEEDYKILRNLCIQLYRIGFTKKMISILFLRKISDNTIANILKQNYTDRVYRNVQIKMIGYATYKYPKSLEELKELEFNFADPVKSKCITLEELDQIPFVENKK